jgi:hypothetical protein
MPYRVVLDLFDPQQAIHKRKQAGVHVAAFPDPLSLDTETGLPFAEDARVKATPLALEECLQLFETWLTLDETPGPSRQLNPAADLFVPGSSSPRQTFKLNNVPTVIQPVFSPLRQLDYRFSKISIDYRDMGPNKQAGSIDVGFGVIHLYRDKKEVYQSDLPLPETSSGTALIEGNGVRLVRVAPSTSDSLQCLIAVLSIPSVMSASEFLLFVEPATEYIRQIRILR